MKKSLHAKAYRDEFTPWYHPDSRKTGSHWTVNGVSRQNLLQFQSCHSGANFTLIRNNALSAADAPLFQSGVQRYSLRRCVLNIS